MKIRGLTIHKNNSRKQKKTYLQLRGSYDTLFDFDFDRSVCIAAVRYPGSISTIYMEIIALSWKIIYTKFREDILDKPKSFL